MEFIKDRWYKNNTFNYYFKYKQCINDTNYWSEKIINCIYNYEENTGNFDDGILLQDLSEIQKYLPEGHPDRYDTNFKQKDNDYTYLIKLLKNIEQ